MSLVPDQSDRDARLSRIATDWSMIADAHRNQAESPAEIRQALVERYSAASYQYLLGAVRDPDVAEELCHELAVRFLRGDFRRADPQRGRFRDYIKKSLINLVNDHFRSRRDTPELLSDAARIAAPLESQPSFEDCLREELLNSTWAALRKANVTYHDVLKMRVLSPDLSSREIAEAVNTQSNKQLTAGAIRKTLERSRAKFAELLLEQVQLACDASDFEQLRVELDQLNLIKYCATALERRSR